jgi:hypothetical protein
MKRFQKLFLAIAVAAFTILLSVGSAQAQLTSFNVGGAGTQASADITLTGILQSSIVLNIQYAGFSGPPTNGVNPGDVATATINYGTFNTRSNAVGAGGTISRTTLQDGAVVRSNLDAWVNVSGAAAAASVRLLLTSGNLDPGSTRFALVSAGVPWTALGDGADLALAQTLCAPCANGALNPHTLALAISDLQTPITFSQVVRYDATM